ncbi:MAG: NADH-quinone oxidoreductase subunit J [Taibaiella sp.]|nr:NADH-quinone oxidoreductase subunit J [Taibaiella sp.]
MELHSILFWILSLMLITCALFVVISRNPVNSVLFLIGAFFCISGHYLLLNAQFLAVVNIIVYAGAIMVLFLFVIMLMNLNADTEPQKSRLVQFAALLSGGVLFLVLVAALKQVDIEQNELLTRAGSEIGLIKHLGQVLFNEYVLPFEISSVLFLSAMVGAIVLGKKDMEKESIPNPIIK